MGGRHLKRSERRSKYGTTVIVVPSPVEVPFISKNEVVVNRSVDLNKGRWIASGKDLKTVAQLQRVSMIPRTGIVTP
jgi:hypothetical protein